MVQRPWLVAKETGEGARGRDGSRSGSETQAWLVSRHLQSVPACNLPADREGASAPGSQEGGHVAKPGGKGTPLT